MSQDYAEVMDMHPGVSHTPYDKSSKEKTGDIIIFAQFEEGNINYLKVMTMQKVATNTMTIKLLHHKLANNKGMQWIQAMILNTGDIIIFAHFEEGNINYLKVMTMQKVATNTMTIKLLHHKLANNKGMQWIQAMILNMNLCLRIC